MNYSLHTRMAQPLKFSLAGAPGSGILCYADLQVPSLEAKSRLREPSTDRDQRLERHFLEKAP